MNKQYQKGYRFEKRVQKDLEDGGFLVFRQGKSAFPDLLVFGRGSYFLVECKYGQNPRLSKEERARFQEMKKKTDATMLSAYGKPRKGIEYNEV